MHTATLTFNQMERRADRALGVVLWAKHVKHTAEGVLLFSVLNLSLRSLLRSLSSKHLESLSDEQAKDLTKTLTELHEGLAGILEHEGVCLLKRTRVFVRPIEKLEQNAEDIADVVHDLRLSCNQEFRAIVADCVTSINTAQSAEPVGRM